MLFDTTGHTPRLVKFYDDCSRVFYDPRRYGVSASNATALLQPVKSGTNWQNVYHVHRTYKLEPVESDTLQRFFSANCQPPLPRAPEWQVESEQKLHATVKLGDALHKIERMCESLDDNWVLHVAFDGHRDLTPDAAREMQVPMLSSDYVFIKLRILAEYRFPGERSMFTGVSDNYGSPETVVEVLARRSEVNRLPGEYKCKADRMFDLAVTDPVQLVRHGSDFKYHVTAAYYALQHQRLNEGKRPPSRYDNIEKELLRCLVADVEFHENEAERKQQQINQIMNTRESK
jgi:hypothetical protein